MMKNRTWSKTLPENFKATFDLRDILQLQSGPKDLLHPTNYLARSTPKRDVDVSCNDEVTEIKIQISSRIITVSRNGLSEKKWKEKLSGLRHDFVASELYDTTDQPLTILGLQSKQTPDCIMLDPPKVLELATCGSSDPNAMNSSWLSKRIAYQNVLENVADYYIMVVSKDVVMSNADIDDATIDILCERCRVGLDLEMQLKELTGIGLNSESSESDRIGLVRECLNEIKNMPRVNTRGMNESLILESHRENSEVEDMHVAELMRKTLKKSMQISKKTSQSAIDEYVQGFDKIGTRRDDKRVQNFPMIYGVRTGSSRYSKIDPLGKNINVPDTLMKVIQFGLAHHNERLHKSESAIKVMSLSESVSGIAETVQHHLRQESLYKPHLTKKDKIYLALTGVGAKALSSEQDIIDKEFKSKKSFDLKTNTDDIETFIKMGDHKDRLNVTAKACASNSTRLSVAAKAKLDRDSLSIKAFKWASSIPLVCIGDLITNCMAEVSYEYKVPTKQGKWLIKKIPNYEGFMMMNCTGSHVFMFFCFKKTFSQNLDTGKLGPDIYETENYYVSDILSYTEVALEHLIKSGPYLKGILLYLLKHFRVPIFSTKVIDVPDSMWETFNGIFLTFLNNKIDIEELMTANRYLHMRALQHFESDVIEFVGRLPSVCRSRLTIFYLNRTINLMRYYDEKKPYKRRTRIRKTQDEDLIDASEMHDDFQTEFHYFRLRCIYHDSPVSMEQLVDTFYFGYVVSKTKGRAGDRSFKIVAKVCKEHYWFKSEIMDKGELLWALREEPKRHCWDPALLRRFTDLWMQKLINRDGKSAHKAIIEDCEKSMSRISFLDIATLKASSKDHEKVFLDLQSKFKITSGKKRVNEIRKNNPNLKGKRPRVITSLSRLIKKYMKDEGDREPSYLKLLLYSMRDLVKRGWIYSDLFPKDQHGGDREIHVIEIRARIIHFAVETISRTIASHIDSDSLTHPKLKDSYMTTHERKAGALLGPHTTVCKSADATRWCQRHHVSKFFFVVSRICKGHDMVYLQYQFFALWTRKRIAIPEELISILENAQDVVSDNKMFCQIRDSFWSGSDPFVGHSSNLIEIEDGMFQGLPHFTSTVIHGICQEPMDIIIHIELESQGIQNVTSVIQGSDDSAMSISIKEPNKKNLLWVHSCLKWKEKISEYLSIWNSSEKSSIGTLNLIEYNSEWWCDGKIIKPTFRWVSAALSTTLSETFYERIQTFYDLITQCLEAGAFTFTCSLLQLCQSELHYKMLGLDNHILGTEMSYRILDACHPAVGYFPLELDYNCGITGFDFSLYYHMREGLIKFKSQDWDLTNTGCTLEYDEQIDRSMRRSLKTIELRFGSKKLHEQIVRDSGLDNLKASVEYLEDNPSILYSNSHDWDTQKSRMTSKLFDPGVYSSLSSYQPTIRSFVASSYLINRPCLSMSDKLSGSSPWNRRKYTLWQASGIMLSDKIQNVSTTDRHVIDKMFPLATEYEKGYEVVKSWQGGLRTIFSNIKARGKVVFMVWEISSPVDFELIDIVRRQWFGHNTVKASQTVFSQVWSKTRAYYGFLEDTHEETCVKNEISAITLKNQIERMGKKKREIRLSDTTAKRKELSNVMSRVLWPNTKVLTSLTSDPLHLSSTMNSLYLSASCPLEETLVNKLIHQILCTKLDAIKLSRDLPKRIQRLCMIRNYLMSKDKESLLLNVTHHRLGVLGYFIQRQEKEHQYYVTKSGSIQQREIPVRRGRWDGIVNGIGTTLSLVGDVCEEIKMTKLDDPLNLGHMLLSLLKEFKVKPKEDDISSEPNIYLNHQGQFEVLRGRVSNKVKIVIEKEYESPVTMSLLKGIWFLSVENMVIRLKSTVKNHDGKSVDVTLLNCPLRATDWLPGKISQLIPKGIPVSMQHWLTNRQIQPFRFLEDIGLSDSKLDLSLLIRDIKNKTRHVVNSIDLNKFVLMMRKTIVSKTSDLRRLYKEKIDQLIRHYSIDEKETFMKEFKADPKLIRAFMSMASNKEFTMKTIEENWKFTSVTMEEAEHSHIAREKLREERGDRLWGDLSSLDSIPSVNTHYTIDENDEEDEDGEFMSNNFNSEVSKEVIDNIKTLFLEREDVFQIIDDHDVMTTGLIPPAIVYFSPLRQLLYSEDMSVEIVRCLDKGDIVGLSNLNFHGICHTYMSLLCLKTITNVPTRERKVQKSKPILLTEEDIPSDESSSDEEEIRSIGMSSTKGREAILTREELEIEVVNLSELIQQSAESLKYELQNLQQRVIMELEFRKLEELTELVFNIRSSHFLAAMFKIIKEENLSSFTDQILDDAESVVMTKIFIRERLSFLDQISAISSSQLRAMMSSLDHSRLTKTLIEACGLAMDKNFSVYKICQDGDEKLEFEMNFPFITGKHIVRF